MVKLFLSGATLALALAGSIPASRVFVALGEAAAPRQQALVRTTAAPKVAGASVTAAVAAQTGEVSPIPCTGSNCIAPTIYALTVMRLGTGAGTVATATTGVTAVPVIDCGTKCSALFPIGSTVTLKAAVSPGSSLSSWRGCTSAVGDTCNVSILSSVTVSATFDALLPVSVTTEQAVVLTQSSAVLRGSANPSGHSASGWFRYATVQPANCTNGFGASTTPAPLGGGTVPVSFANQVGGLVAGTTYYYCALAGDSLGTAFGVARSFTTPGIPAVQKPDLTVVDLQLVRPTTATARYLVATVKNIGSAPVVQSVGLDMFDSAGVRYAVSLLYSASSSLAPGASVEVTGSRATEGSYTYRAVVDQANTVDELEEQNNELAKLLVLSTVDIRAGSVKVANLRSRSATVTWRTNMSATGQVHFDVGTNITLQSSMAPPEVRNQAMTIDHAVLLNDLLPNQQYVFRITGGNGQGAAYTSSTMSFTTFRVGEDLPDLVPQTLFRPGTMRTYAGYPYNSDNVSVWVRNTSRFDAGPFGVWLLLRDAATGALQCSPAVSVDGLAANRSTSVDFDVNSFLHCAPLEAKRYYLEVDVDKSPVSDVNQVVESNETNNVRTSLPFTVAPAADAPHALNFILRPDLARTNYLRFEFSVVNPFSTLNYLPRLYYTIDPTDGPFDSAASIYTRQAVVHRDTTGRYYATFENTPGLRYHVRVVPWHTNVATEDIVLSAVP